MRNQLFKLFTFVVIFGAGFILSVTGWESLAVAFFVLSILSLF